MTEEQRIKQRAYRAANYEAVQANRKKWRDANCEKIKAQKKAWRDANPEKCKMMNFNNRDKVKSNKYQVLKYNTDSLFRMRKIVGGYAHNHLLYERNKEVNSKAKKVLGCSFEFLKKHLESQFEKWMNWGNYGEYDGTPNSGWEIDHIIPISTAKTEDGIIKLGHYTNIRPLCIYLNRRRGRMDDDSSTE